MKQALMASHILIDSGGRYCETGSYGVTYSDCFWGKVL